MTYEIAAGLVAVTAALIVALLTFLGAKSKDAEFARYQVAAQVQIAQVTSRADAARLETEKVRQENLRLAAELELQMQETARVAKEIDDAAAVDYAAILTAAAAPDPI